MGDVIENFTIEILFGYMSSEQVPVTVSQEIFRIYENIDLRLVPLSRILLRNENKPLLVEERRFFDIFSKRTFSNVF